MISTQVEVTVPFHDIDTMDVAWHGHYAKYFEIARCALLDKLDYDYPAMRESGYAWPVIDMHIRYAGPATYQQKLQVTAKLAEWENRLKIQYQIHDRDSGKRLTKGHTIQVAVDMQSGEMCYASPQVLLDKVAAANQ